ncbi:MAG: hypothetical protein RI556_00235 [Hydrogenovibrio sp.]|uniref:hypothetical protein n=1 Tax=Hydrogenovibrio sp. TaxID=2065821 RepID=UPI00286FDF3B|nr:hypothetical protein [Hydrogenovibrio sp.]MDR9497581.1 hypothetical protein [Hydrogenovibrio sp.]
MKQTKRNKQSGAITILAVSAILGSMAGVYATMELMEKSVQEETLDSYARALSPVVLRQHLALTQQMVQEGEYTSPESLVKTYLIEVGFKNASEFDVTTLFGNVEEQGGELTFVPLSSNPESPKLSASGETAPASFSALKLTIRNETGQLMFYPEGQAVYGLSPEMQDDASLTICYCDLRYEACLTADKTSPIMPQKGTQGRVEYCELGYVPKYKGKQATYHSIDFSPQWIGRSYDEQTADAPAWSLIDDQVPIEINNGEPAFPEAGWDAETGEWVTPAPTIMGDYKRRKNAHSFDEGTEPVTGEFYLGRTATCADINGLMLGVVNTSGFLDNCISYDNSARTDYEPPQNATKLFEMMENIEGTNENFVSCYSFSGDPNARVPFSQWFTRIWFFKTIDWDQAYGNTQCATSKMRWFDDI